MLISALIICRNEEKVIERCLQSLLGHFDEIVIIHDGICEDNTLKIAHKYTSEVYEMSEHRGIGECWYYDGFNRCKGNWVFRIDADEYLSLELQASLKELIKNPDIDGYSFLWPMWDGCKYISTKALRKNFLFRKSRIGFLEKSHYPIKVMGQLFNSDLLVHHKPMYNNWTDETFARKQMKWALLQAKDHLKSIDDCRILGLNKADLLKEQKRKDFLYKAPLVAGLVAYLSQLTRLIMDPGLAIDKGFWISTRYATKYSYHVALEVKRLRQLSSK